MGKLLKSKRPNMKPLIVGPQNAIFKNSEQLFKSFRLNGIFWITLLFAILVLTKYNSNNISIWSSLYTIIFAIFSGWYVHYLSHAYSLEKLYAESTNVIATTLQKNKQIDKIIRIFIRYTFDFHDKYHHDSSINKQPFYIVWEFLVNLFLEGGWLIIIANLFSLKIKICNVTLQFNKAILLLWGLLYASAHNINYMVLGCDQHVKHHLDPTTNYGIDTMDILMNTKYSTCNIENFNHAAINIVVITLLILYFKVYL